MDFRQLQYFMAAVEQRTMSAAARICRVTQPTLSAQIKRLETELDKVLFDRTAVGLEPTPDAYDLYRASAHILEKAAHGLHYIRARTDVPVEELHIRSPYSAASLLGLLIKRGAAKLVSAHPHVRVVHHCGETGAGPDLVPHLDLHHSIVSSERNDAVLPDTWLLVQIASNDKRNTRYRDIQSLDGILDVPALPLNIQDALAGLRPLPPGLTVRMQGENAADLVSSILSRNRGQMIVPRLSINHTMLRHPRLHVSEIRTGLPAIGIVFQSNGGSEAERHRQADLLRELTTSRKTITAGPPAPLPDTRQLRYFLHVFEEGGMSRAAAKLNVVQPAISMQIRALERRFGGKLFERTRQGIYPTEAGRKVQAIYAPVLDQLHLSQRRRAPAIKPPRPMLRVGVLPGLDEDSLLVRATTATIMEWEKTFAGIELKVVESHSGVLLDWLSGSIIDVAIVEDMHARTALRETVLSSEPLAVLMSTAYAGVASGPIRLNDIGNLNLVLPSNRHGLRSLMDRAFADAGLSLLPRLELDSMASAVRLVKSGGWATVMPPSAVQRSLDDQLLVARPIVKPSVNRELRAVQMPRHRNKWASIFIRLLREKLASGTTADA